MGKTKAPEATEAAAELAKEHSLDLDDVKGTGSEGRITVDDVKAAIERASAAKSGGEGGEGSKSKSKSKAKSDDARMPAQAHLEGCPRPEGRVEVYEQRVPPKVNSGGGVERPPRMATIAHCVECGASCEIDG